MPKGMKAKLARRAAREEEAAAAVLNGKMHIKVAPASSSNSDVSTEASTPRNADGTEIQARPLPIDLNQIGWRHHSRGDIVLTHVSSINTLDESYVVNLGGRGATLYMRDLNPRRKLKIGEQVQVQVLLLPGTLGRVTRKPCRSCVEEGEDYRKTCESCRNNPVTEGNYKKGTVTEYYNEKPVPREGSITEALVCDVNDERGVIVRIGGGVVGILSSSDMLPERALKCGDKVKVKVMSGSWDSRYPVNYGRVTEKLDAVIKPQFTPAEKPKNTMLKRDVPFVEVGDILETKVSHIQQTIGRPLYFVALPEGNGNGKRALLPWNQMVPKRDLKLNQPVTVRIAGVNTKDDKTWKVDVTEKLAEHRVGAEVGEGRVTNVIRHNTLVNGVSHYVVEFNGGYEGKLYKTDVFPPRSYLPGDKIANLMFAKDEVVQENGKIEQACLTQRRSVNDILATLNVEEKFSGYVRSVAAEPHSGIFIDIGAVDFYSPVKEYFIPKLPKELKYFHSGQELQISIADKSTEVLQFQNVTPDKDSLIKSTFTQKGNQKFGHRFDAAKQAYYSEPAKTKN